MRTTPFSVLLSRSLVEAAEVKAGLTSGPNLKMISNLHTTGICAS